MEVIAGLVVLIGLLFVAVGIISVAVPLRILRLSTRGRGAAAALVGFVLLIMGGALVQRPNAGELATVDTAPAETDMAAKPALLEAFEQRLASGASCAELFEIRNQPDPKSPVVEAMNRGLREIRCFSASSVRDSRPDESRGTFTVKEYQVYRAVMDTPMSVPEGRAIESAAKIHGMSVSDAKAAIDKVTTELFTNKWFNSPELEVRHAIDWGQQQ